jgi:hypothetical protein
MVSGVDGVAYVSTPSGVAAIVLVAGRPEAHQR